MAVKKATKSVQHSSVSPKLGAKIDALYTAREARLAKQREVEALEERERAAKQEVIALLDSANLQKAAGKLASVSLSPQVVANVEPDAWNKVFAYVKKNDAFDLLQKRINNSAFRDRIEAGEKIPGTTSVTVINLSVRAAGSK